MLKGFKYPINKLVIYHENIFKFNVNLIEEYIEWICKNGNAYKYILPKNAPLVVLIWITWTLPELITMYAYFSTESTARDFLKQSFEVADIQAKVPSEFNFLIAMLVGEVIQLIISSNY